MYLIHTSQSFYLVNANSRTSKSIKNSSVALIVNFVSLILNFFSRKVFLEYLGTDLLGLNTTAMNILQFLNLAEMGIGGAISFTLYKPLLNKDNQSVAEIIYLQGRIYKTIGGFVLLGSAIVMAFFPLIFSKITLPLWYAYSSFSVFLFSTLLGYFFNYRQILLSADQKEYVIQLIYRTVMIIKIFFQMIAMLCFPYPYIWWLSLEVVFAVISAVLLSDRINYHFPYLKYVQVPTFKILKGKYKGIITKVKQIFFHKVAAFVLVQSSPLVIYALIDLKVVTLYGNYLLIVNGLIVLTNSIFNGMIAGIGNLIAEGNKDQIIRVFFELFSIRSTIALILAFSLFSASSWFIGLWIGTEYILPPLTVGLISLTLFINISRTTVDSFLWGYGLYKDIWAPIVEAVLNLSLSIILGKFYGLNGILSGVLISLIIVICGWKPFFLFRNGIKTSVREYFKVFFRIGIISLLGVIGAYYLSRNGWLFIQGSASNAILEIIIFSCYVIGTLLLLRDKGTLQFYTRIRTIISKGKTLV